MSLPFTYLWCLRFVFILFFGLIVLSCWGGYVMGSVCINDKCHLKEYTTTIIKKGKKKQTRNISWEIIIVYGGDMTTYHSWFNHSLSSLDTGRFPPAKLINYFKINLINKVNMNMNVMSLIMCFRPLCSSRWTVISLLIHHLFLVYGKKMLAKVFYVFMYRPWWTLITVSVFFRDMLSSLWFMSMCNSRYNLCALFFPVYSSLLM